jgi:hypothetical protein
MVVGVMTCEQGGDGFLGHDPTEEIVPNPAGDRLDALAILGGQSGDVGVADDQPNPQPFTEGAAEGLVPVGLIPSDAVVQVSGGDGSAVRRLTYRKSAL